MILDEIFETKEEMLEKYDINISKGNFVINGRKIPLEAFLSILECSTASHNIHWAERHIHISIETNFIIVRYKRKEFIVKPFKVLQWTEIYNKYNKNKVNELIMETDYLVRDEKNNFVKPVREDIKEEKTDKSTCIYSGDNVSPPYHIKSEEQLT